MGNAKLVIIPFRVVRAVGGGDVIPNRISLPEKAIILSGALLGIERESISYFITKRDSIILWNTRCKKAFTACIRLLLRLTEIYVKLS